MAHYEAEKTAQTLALYERTHRARIDYIRSSRNSKCIYIIAHPRGSIASRRSGKQKSVFRSAREYNLHITQQCARATKRSAAVRNHLDETDADHRRHCVTASSANRKMLGFEFQLRPRRQTSTARARNYTAKLFLSDHKLVIF